MINETDALSQDKFSLGRGGPIAADITNYHENKTQFSGRSQSDWPSNSFLLRHVVRPRLRAKWDRVTPGTAVVLEVGLSLNQKNKLQCGVPISFHLSTFLFGSHMWDINFCLSSCLRDGTKRLRERLLSPGAHGLGAKGAALGRKMQEKELPS